MKYVIVISHMRVIQAVYGPFSSMAECKRWIAARPPMVQTRLDYSIQPLERPYVTTKPGEAGKKG